MEKKLVVLDFDGTITEAEAEGTPHIAGYTEDLCTLLKSKEVVMQAIKDAETKIVTNPNEHGWLYNGLIVAPAMVDPYLRMQGIAQLVFDHFGLYADRADRVYLLDFLHAKNYRLSDTVFKAGVQQMLSELCTRKEIALHIVTNSHTDGVRKKIVTLSKGINNLSSLSDRVIGGAKKYLVGERPDHIPTTMSLTGLARSVYLRRTSYFDILDSLRAMYGLNWNAVTVIGDIFELDLALPFALGARVGLMLNQFTPHYEQNFVASNPDRARLIKSPDEVISFVS